MNALIGALTAAAVAAVAHAAGPIRATVDFQKKLRDWDGFGVNYVETAQTRDYQANPQDYGGFSTLAPAKRHEILDLIFGPDGLKPGLVKMFLDPFHEPANDNNDPDLIDAGRFDHTTTTRWMRLFVREGLKRTRARGGDLTIITTLYGPPAWMTKQRFVRGRELDPEYKHEAAEYMIAWARHLRAFEGFPVKHISLHNEGEDYARWPVDGSTADKPSHDYNLWWPPEQVAEFIKLMRPMLDRQGMKDVGVTPGETTNWYRFSEWGYADAIASDAAAARSLGLITSHGFINFGNSRWFGDYRPTGNDLLRARNPSLHSWVTSQSWSKMDAHFVNEMRGNIYATKVNAIIPWAVVQRHSLWIGGDPNPGCAFRVDDAGNYEVRHGYYLFKQVCRAGQPGMAVAHVSSLDTQVGLIAFASNGTKNPDAFVVINIADTAKPLAIAVNGAASRSFDAYRTSPAEQYQSLGTVRLEAGVLTYSAPPGSVTTFTGR